MRNRLAVAVVTALLLGAAPGVAQQLEVLPPGTWANDVTPDGNIVVGSAPGGEFLIDDPSAFPWGINTSNGLRGTTP